MIWPSQSEESRCTNRTPVISTKAQYKSKANGDQSYLISIFKFEAGYDLTLQLQIIFCFIYDVLAELGDVSLTSLPQDRV